MAHFAASENWGSQFDETQSNNIKYVQGCYSLECAVTCCFKRKFSIFVLKNCSAPAVLFV